MTDKNFLKQLATSKDDYILLSNFCDKLDNVTTNNNVTHTKFLDPHQQALIEQVIKHYMLANCVFNGGIEDAQRRVCIILPTYSVTYQPLIALRATKSNRDTLSHRDYLGSLMGLGLQREMIGDIIVNEYGADIIVLKEISEFILISYSKAGRKQLSIAPIEFSDIKTCDTSQLIRTTVASLRFDVMVSEIFNVSRSISLSLIKSGKAMLNHIECVNPAKTLCIGDRITVRNKGKAVLNNILGVSKKGKTIVELKMFV